MSSSFTRLDGSTVLLESNDEVLVHGVDIEGHYLGLVSPEQAISVANGPPPSNGNWLWIFDGWRPYKTLDEVKAEAWSVFKQHRSALEYSGFEWDGSIFDSDAISQARIMGSVQLASMALAQGLPFAQPWTLADNTVRTLSAAEMISVGIALATHVSTVHARGREVRSEIEAATDDEEVGAVSW